MTRNRPESTTVVQVIVVQAAVFVGGGLLLWWLATPLYVDEMSSLGAASWPLLCVPSLAWAVLSGTLAGLSIRLRWPWWVAATALVLVALPALYVPAFFVSRWPGSTVQETNLSDLVAALLGWTLYAVASTALPAAIGARARARVSGQGPRGG